MVDDVIVGAGIIGLAHAYHLAIRGRRVAVFERSPRARGASTRNFGMIWPIGQPFGPRRELARASRSIWLQILVESGLWHEQSGSLHLAYHDDEAAVLEEFASLSRDHGDPVELLSPRQVHQRAARVKGEGLRAGLLSNAEICVDPRQVVADLPGWLHERFGVRFHFGRRVIGVEPGSIHAGSERIQTDRVWICAGDDLDSLFPDQYQALGLVRCKLQMMRSAALADGSRIGPMLAGGLTPRHYESFRACPSLPALRQRIARETPWFDEYGIHVMASQNGLGELTIGDSHEYGDAIEPFDQARIDDFILAYLHTFLDLPELAIASRWHGVYVKHPAEVYVTIKPIEGVVGVTGLGGAGMTLSFGVAQRVVQETLS